MRRGFRKWLVIATCLLVISLAGSIACNRTGTDDLPEKAFRTMVELYDTQVIRMETLTVSLGQCAGSDRILTVIDYDDFASGKFRLDKLRVAGQQTAIELVASDAQTGAILFRVPGMDVAKGTFRDTATLKNGEKVMIAGWYGPSSYGQQIPATVYGTPDRASPTFSILVSINDLADTQPVPYSGATVTDMKGRILGLAQTTSDGWTHLKIEQDMVIHVVSIERILTQLETNSTK